MKIIPVIDLLDNQVVRAQRGERDRYRPIESTLSRSSNPQEIAEAMLGLYPFDTLYIADLDAIQGKGNHFSAVANIRSRHPDITIWLDGGFSRAQDFTPWQSLDITFVVGSESLGSIEELRQMRDTAGDSGLVLSLDWRGENPLGPAALFKNAEEWPESVIVMTLGRVGSYDGPDMPRLKQARQLGGNHRIHAAGGVRNVRDLYDLQGQDIDGALLASTLHDGRISREELQAFAQAPSNLNHTAP